MTPEEEKNNFTFSTNAIFRGEGRVAICWTNSGNLMASKMTSGGRFRTVLLLRPATKLPSFARLCPSRIWKVTHAGMSTWRAKYHLFAAIIGIPGVSCICETYPLYLIARAEQFVDNSAGLLSVPAANFTQGRNRCFKVLIMDVVLDVGYRQPNCSLAQCMQDLSREMLKLSHQRGCNLKKSHTERKESQRTNELSLLNPTAFGHLKSLPPSCVMKPVTDCIHPLRIFRLRNTRQMPQ